MTKLKSPCKDYNFVRKNMKEAEIQDIVFENCLFHLTDLERATLTNCTFKDCYFLCTHLKGAKINNCTFKDCCFQGVIGTWSLWNGTKIEGRGYLWRASDFSLGSFSRCKITDVTFTCCGFVETDLSDSDIVDCTFDFCEMQRAWLNTKSSIRYSCILESELGAAPNVYGCEDDKP